LLVFGLGVVATTALASLASLGGHSLLVGLANLAASAAVNAALFLVAFRVLTPRQVPTGQLLVGAAVAGVLFTLLQAVGGYLVGHDLKHAQAVYGFFAIVLGLMSWLFLSGQVTLYGAEVNVVRARRLWPAASCSRRSPKPTSVPSSTLPDKKSAAPSKPSTSSSPPRAANPTLTITRTNLQGQLHPPGGGS
jgi:uncharacterized BrkB/YihY/UPF0761 family membrane protein